MSLDSKTRRRLFGAICLLASIVLLVVGETLLKGRIRNLSFLFYWMVCLIFTFLAICTALWDAYSVRQEGRRQQRELLETTLDTVKKTQRDQN